MRPFCAVSPLYDLAQADSAAFSRAPELLFLARPPGRDELRLAKSEGREAPVLILAFPLERWGYQAGTCRLGWAYSLEPEIEFLSLFQFEPGRGLAGILKGAAAVIENEVQRGKKAWKPRPKSS